ncbi:putative ABC transport system permease protein [Arthrobacter subterraneus]|uniref:Putative ABC transport system permease protein n=1 Tax=Arthrobacter subterraneus TaxID=335973 RepID=A0A1G8CDB2_9MICC|nr:FtsX-like permease family protein [Arthrobacter subterraneus]SDH43497.1 putative ABC transport system permease protein [Arthrobacter subterraneus]
MTLYRLLHRQFRRSRWPSVLLASIVLVVSALLCAWPRAVDAMYTADLRESVAELAGSQQAVRAFSSAFPPAEDLNRTFTEAEDGGRTADALTDIREGLAQPLASVLGEGRWLATGVGSRVTPLPEGIRELILNYAADMQALEHLELREGELPGPPPAEYGGEPVEILLSQASAESARWQVGEERNITVLLRGSADGDSREVREQPVVLSGTYAAKDPGSPYWSLNNSLLTAAEDFNPDTGTAVNATAFISPAAFPFLAPAVDHVQTSYWYPVSTDTLTAGTAGQTAAQLRELLGTPQHVPAAVSPGPTVVFGSETPAAMADATQRAASTHQILALLASGPLGVCVATAALAVRLLLERRRGALALASARGAGDLQLRGALALDGLLIGVPAAALGALAAFLLVPVPFSPAHLLWPVLAAFLPAVLMAVQHRPEVQTRQDLTSSARNRWRVSAEAAVVVLAVTATILLTGRGLVRGSLEYGEVDPLLSATPLLIALAVGVLVLRLYPLPLQEFARIRRRSPGLVGFLGASRAVRAPGAGLVPVLALVVGLAVVLLSGVLLSTFREGVTAAAESRVGADLRIQGPPFDGDQVEQIRSVEGVASVAAVTDLGRLRTETGGRQTKDVDLHAVSPDALLGVQEDLSGAFPADVLNALSERASGDALPVVVSPALELEEGTTLELRYRGMYVEAEVVGTGPAEVVFSSSTAWALVDEATIGAVEERTFQPSVLLVDLHDDAGSVTDAVAEIAGGPVLQQTPGEQVERVLASASGRGLQLGLWVVIGAMAVLCSLTVVMTAVVNAPARNRLIALLRTLGFPQRRDGALMLWELGPMTGAAMLAGTMLGLLLPLVILGALNLSAFTGGSVEPALALHPGLLLGLMAGFLLVVAASVVGAVTAGRRQRLAAVLGGTDI